MSAIDAQGIEFGRPTASDSVNFAEMDEGYSFRSDKRAAFARDFPVHVGVDCAKTFHKLVARGPDGRRRVAIRVDVTRDGFVAADRYLRTTFHRVPRRRVLIGLEIN